MFVTVFTVPKVNLWSGIPLPIPVVTGGMGLMRILKNGQQDNSRLRIWNQMTKLKFQWMLRKQKILNLRGTNEEIMCFPRWETSKNRGRGSFEGTLEHIVSKHIQHISFLI